MRSQDLKDFFDAANAGEPARTRCPTGAPYRRTWSRRVAGAVATTLANKTFELDEMSGLR
jgi:hypothetical protein